MCGPFSSLSIPGKHSQARVEFQTLLNSESCSSKHLAVNNFRSPLENCLDVCKLSQNNLQTKKSTSGNLVDQTTGQPGCRKLSCCIFYSQPSLVLSYVCPSENTWPDSDLNGRDFTVSATVENCAKQGHSCVSLHCAQ